MRPELISGGNAPKSNTYIPPRSNDMCSLASCFHSTTVTQVARCEAKSPRSPAAAPAMWSIVRQQPSLRRRPDGNPRRDASSAIFARRWPSPAGIPRRHAPTTGDARWPAGCSGVTRADGYPCARKNPAADKALLGATQSHKPPAAQTPFARPLIQDSRNTGNPCRGPAPPRCRTPRRPAACRGAVSG